MILSDLTNAQKYRLLAQEEAKIWERLDHNFVANWTEVFEEKAQRFADRIVIEETQTGHAFTYRDLSVASNAVADYIRAHIPDRHIGLYYHNSFLFLAALIGINKTGRLAVLFNTNEPVARLQTLAQKSDVHIVLGDPITGLEHVDIGYMIETPTQAPVRIADFQIERDDAAFVIFTSGTSGPSKPALFSHRRMIGAGIAWSLRTFMKSDDRCYIPLPLYHGNGLAVAFSAVVTAGARAILRPKFSVTHFFKDIERFGCTHMVYIGELWRYLSNRYPNRQSSTLHTIFGNGLHRELWETVVPRFGIRHIVEHFGATEMPASALTNWMDVPGYCGYIPPSHPDAKDVLLIDEAGNEVPENTPGEAIFRVPNNRYRGYLDPKLDEPKLLERNGVLWWRSGDLLTRNKKGFFTFVDRAGDTYRFKGENVATADVESALMQTGLFTEAVVYGIALPHIEGKIGMASLLPVKPLHEAEFTLLLQELKQSLASYALPYFLVIRNKPHETTSTLKIKKRPLAEAGIKYYDQNDHYLLLDGKYRKIDDTLFRQLQEGTIIPGEKR